LVIHGDAKRRRVLQETGFDRALGHCLVIDNDADNLYITAKALNAKLNVFTRTGQKRYAEAMRPSGADEVDEGGQLASSLIQKYAARSV
jgi:Trk K+ transport system NAD-binding subunit